MMYYSCLSTPAKTQITTFGTLSFNLATGFPQPTQKSQIQQRRTHRHRPRMAEAEDTLPSELQHRIILPPPPDHVMMDSGRDDHGAHGYRFICSGEDYPPDYVQTRTEGLVCESEEVKCKILKAWRKRKATRRQLRTAPADTAMRRELKTAAIGLNQLRDRATC